MLLGLAACGSSDGSEEDGVTTAGGSLQGMTVDGEVGESLEVSYDGKVTAGEAESQVLAEGDGNPVEANSNVLMHLYIGNGTAQKQSVNTYEQGPAVSVRMSEDQLFKPVPTPSSARTRAPASPSPPPWRRSGAPRASHSCS
jgi:hypothetical protein